jgi:hypothetical protein
MKKPNIAALRRWIAPALGLAALLLPAHARAAEDPGWSLNFTPVLLPKDDYRVGGGTDPELKYSRDLGCVRWSAGGRVGAYYAKNQRHAVLPARRLSVLVWVSPALARPASPRGQMARAVRARDGSHGLLDDRVLSHPDEPAGAPALTCST